MSENETPIAEKRCKQCGNTKILPVVYGLPLPETFERAALGEVLLGGCVVMGSQPDYRCADCGEPFDMEEFSPQWVKDLVRKSREDRAETPPTGEDQGEER